MPTILLVLALLVAAILSLILILYLVRVILALRGGSRDLYQLVDRLDQIEQDTRPLTAKMGAVDGALDVLMSELDTADERLTGITTTLSR